MASRAWARNGITTFYSYSEATGEISSINYTDGTPSVSYTYDRLGRKKTVTDAVGTRNYEYDDPSLQETSETITGIIEGTVNHTYVSGKISGVNIGMGSYSIAYDYDTMGRMNQVNYSIGALGDNATYTFFTDSDLLSSLTSGNGRLTTFLYSPGMNLISLVENKFEENVLSRYSYTYDAIGRRSTTEVSGSEFAKALNAKSKQAWFQAAQISSNGIEVLPATRTYGYDPIGNRKTATGWDDNVQAQATTNYTTSTLNQYASVNTAALVYDLDGNLIEDDNKRYTYDGENRLVAVEPKTPQANDKKALFAYDYMGRRVKKESYTYQTGAWAETDETLYLYDGWNMIRELNASGQTKRSYVWGLDLSGTLQGSGGIGGLLASVDASGMKLKHYYFDANGNVSEIVENATGDAVAHYEYAPFGNIIYSSGGEVSSNPYCFSTKYNDSETGLVYYGYRYYSPDLGRWVNRDPIEESGAKQLITGALSKDTDQNAQNNYRFINNETYLFIDPLGLRPLYPIEEGYLRKYFGNSILYPDIDIDSSIYDFGLFKKDIADGSWMSPYDGKILVPLSSFIDSNPCNEIDFTSPLTREFKISILNHEVFHYWQRLRGVNVTVDSIVSSPLLYLLRKFAGWKLADPYYYNEDISDQGLVMDMFIMAGFEAQAKMWQDYVYASETNKNIQKWSKVSQYVRSHWIVR